MRRIGIIFSGLLVLVMAQGCGTTNRNKMVIDKPGQTTAAPAKTAATSEVSPYSSKGGTAAKPGTVGVNLSTPSTAAKTKTKVVKAQPAPPPEASKEVATDESTTAAVAPTPAPPKAEAIAKPVKSTPAKTTATAKPSAQTATAKPGERLGAVRQINPEYKFIVIEFDSEKPLPVGTQLQIWRGGKAVAKAQLEEPLEHWPLGTASLIEGTPEKDDLVTP